VENGSQNAKSKVPMTDDIRRRIIESRFRNKFKRHRDRLNALRIYDIMTRVARGDYN
jgi:hypothetical protein